MKRQTLLLVLAFALLFAASACGGPTPEPTALPEATDIAQPTNTRVLTDTPVPTDTPIPTDTPTPEPTDTATPTDTPEPTDTPVPTETPLPLGEQTSFSDWDYLVAEATSMSSIGAQPARGVFIVALIEMTNNGETERSIGGQFFVATDSQGRLYEMDSDASLEYHHTFGTAAWHLEDIAPSASARIPVVFDVSPGATGMLLRAAGKKEPRILLIEDVGGEPLQLPEGSQVAADWSYVVTNVGTASTIGDETARGQYVVATLKARNDSKTPRELGTSLFVLRDEQDRVYDLDSEASLAYYHAFDTDAWTLESLGPSLIGTIPLAFDVSPDATNLTLYATQGETEPVPVLEAVGGESIELTGAVYTIANWEFAVSDSSRATSIGDEIPQGEFLVVLVDVKNLALTSQDLGGHQFKAKDSQGRTYDLDTDASLEYHHTYTTNAWHLESIGPSLAGTVPLVFDVAADASSLTLVTQDGTEVPLQ